jgi:hypothetical protein
MTRNRIRIGVSTLLVASSLLAAAPASAWHEHVHARFYYGPPGPRVGVVGWRGGGWHHAWHGGRYGWWWVVGPGWWYYDAPVYPYPDPEVVVVDQPAPPGPPPAQYWYYCRNPNGYYPYVPQCPGGWESVPASPPPAPPR